MRISDWSSDVCSSYLEQVVLRTGSAVGQVPLAAEYVPDHACGLATELFGTFGRRVPPDLGHVIDAEVVARDTELLPVRDRPVGALPVRDGEGPRLEAEQTFLEGLRREVRSSGLESADEEERVSPQHPCRVRRRGLRSCEPAVEQRDRKSVV